MTTAKQKSKKRNAARPQTLPSKKEKPHRKTSGKEEQKRKNNARRPQPKNSARSVCVVMETK